MIWQSLSQCYAICFLSQQRWREVMFQPNYISLFAFRKQHLEKV